MELKEAIQHLEESIRTMPCSSCRDEHIQLWRWLHELSEYRKLLASANLVEHQVGRYLAPGDIPQF